MQETMEMPATRKDAGARSVRSLLVRQRDGLASVRLAQVEYVAYKDHVLAFHLSDGRTVYSRVLKESFTRVVERSLSDSRFVRPHESYLVNMDYVHAMTATGFEMKSGDAVPISKRIFQRVREDFVQYTVGDHRERIL